MRLNVRNLLWTMTKAIRCVAGIITLFYLLSAGCTPNGMAERTETLSGTLTVFAAASLTEPFTAMVQPLKKRYPDLRIRFNFAGSQTLRTQLEQGAQADVFHVLESGHPQQEAHLRPLREDLLGAVGVLHPLALPSLLS